jgi:hypothetical protein
MKITPIREVGNLIFGANMRTINKWSIDQILVTPQKFYDAVMPVVGYFNQKHNDGNGYNSVPPFYGEHTYSGTDIFAGYWFGHF